MRERPSSRLLIIDTRGRILLFKFEHKHGPLAGQSFWATPGGGLDPGETYEDAACRELLEETGLRLTNPGPQVARRTAVFQLVDGEWANADERFFLVHADTLDMSDSQWTDLEREVMTAHRWWSASDLRSASEQIWPENLAELLVEAGVW